MDLTREKRVGDAAPHSMTFGALRVTSERLKIVASKMTLSSTFRFVARLVDESPLILMSSITVPQAAERESEVRNVAPML